MALSEVKVAYISLPTYNTSRLNLGKRAFFILLFPNMLTNPIILQICDVTLHLSVVLISTESTVKKFSADKRKPHFSILG